MNLLVVTWLWLGPVDSLYLRDVQQEAMARHPLKRQITTQRDITDLRLDNLNVRYYPDVSLNGQVAHQSQVIELPIKLPTVSVPSPDKDSYQLNLVANQLIYDFGNVSLQKAIERSHMQYETQAVEVELNKLKAQVNDAFFAILMMQEKEKSLALTHEDVMARLSTVKNRVTNGTLLPSNQSILEAELLKISQQMAETRANRDAAIETLETLLDRDLPEDIVLVTPPIMSNLVSMDVRRRPEFGAFDLSKEKINRTITWVERRNRPKLSAFLQLSYARPGLNTFATSFQEYYVAGIRVSWNFWNWNTDRRDRHVLRLQQDLVSSQEESFARSLRVAAKRHLNEISKTEALIKIDRDIIALRGQVTRQMASQLDHGVVTSSEYLTELNAEHQARLTLEWHKLQLVRAQTDYLTLLGE